MSTPISPYGRRGAVTVSVDLGTGLSVPGPVLGLAAQFAVLGTTSATVGLSLTGWLVGSMYAVATWAVLTGALRRARMTALGPANVVTLTRATLVGGVTALVATSLTRPVPVAALVALAAVALALDGVDGQVARRTGTTTKLGARFDMETDAFLILVLSLYVAQQAGWWVLAIGAFRYLFVAASWWLTWLRGPLEPRMWRKTVAAVQGIVLAVAASGLLPHAVSTTVVAVSLGLLTWSFGRDIRALYRAGHQPSDEREHVAEPAGAGLGGTR